MSRRTVIVVAGLTAAVGIIACPDRVARWAALPLLALLLTACASPEPAPPGPLPAPIVCAAPAGMTAIEAEPDRPAGDYTQRDVARYLVDLHQWGAAGWARVEAIADYSDACQQRHGVNDE